MPRPLSSLLLIFSGLALFVWMLPERVSGQAGQAIVIEGGTLIDGNVGAPVPDVQIVIRGNKIASVGKKGAPFQQVRKLSTRTGNSFSRALCTFKPAGMCWRERRRPERCARAGSSS
jgi:hypothetical protein